MKQLITLLFIFFGIQISMAQVPRETRAVWVTTNFQLDWPPKTFDQQKQKQALVSLGT
jgi:hypothetical protein